MSNQAVGSIYDRIINDVISNSQVDFEESGVSRAVLEELRGRWQAKLSSLMVADFPWDPQPTPPSPGTANGAGSSSKNGENGLAQQQQSQSQSQPHQQLLPSAASALPTPTSMTPAAANSATSSSGSVSAAAVDGVRIKPEPGAEEDEVLLPSMSSVPPAPIAVAGGGAQRATVLLQQKFGPKANPSIGALHQTAQKSPAGQAQAAHPAAGRTDGACDDGIQARLAHLALGGDSGGDAAWAAERAKARIEGDENGSERMRLDEILFRKRSAGDEGPGGVAEIRPLWQTRATKDIGTRKSSTPKALPADPTSSPSRLSPSLSPSSASSDSDGDEEEESVMLSFSSAPPPPSISPTQSSVWTSQLDGTANHYHYNQQQQQQHPPPHPHQYQHQLTQSQPRVKAEAGRSVEIGEDDDDDVDDVVDTGDDAMNGGGGGGVTGGGVVGGGGAVGAITGGGGSGDDDAINSDLDDPEDDLDDAGEDDEANPQIMLCMYDKVTRTKNKWKCILKDGVLTVGGREYVFQKATGEFEW